MFFPKAETNTFSPEKSFLFSIQEQLLVKFSITKFMSLYLVFFSIVEVCT